MKRNTIWFWIFFILIVFLLFRLAGGVLVIAVRIAAGILRLAAVYWYITLPVALYLILRPRPKHKNKDTSVVDAEFKVMDEDEEDESK